MRLSRAVLVGAALTLIAACSKQDPATDRSGWITIQGYVENGAIENGLLWFKFQQLTSPAVRHNLDNAARIERELEGRLAAGDLKPTPAPCDGYWESGETRREKSPLLNERSQASPVIAFASPQMRTGALSTRRGFT